MVLIEIDINNDQLLYLQCGVKFWQTTYYDSGKEKNRVFACLPVETHIDNRMLAADNWRKIGASEK
jgi:hypothetical protein